jgi:hypothetical protein
MQADAMTIHPEHHGEHVEAGAAAHVNITRLALPRSAWELIVALILAVSILVNLICFLRLRDIDTRKWLHDYDLNQFQMGEFRQLQREVDLDHALLQQEMSDGRRDNHH